MRTVKSTDQSGERGIALVMALLMILAVSIVTGSLVLVARTESLSSVSYTSMSQVRYGAESGVHAAANYLLNTYAVPAAANAQDPIGVYDLTVSPVRWNGRPVLLSSDAAVASNYPVPAVITAFQQNSLGTLNVNGAPVAHAARATLMSMKTVTDFYTQQPMTLQTWQIEGVGRIQGLGQSLVEVEATLERQRVPVFNYAAFATNNSCGALSFAGGAETHSYDSGNLALGIANTGGNVGTNGNLDGNGGPTTINGTLSTPRAGVGNCTTNNVTAATISGWGVVEEGLVTLPQPVVLPTPPDFTPPTTSVSFGGGSCPAGVPYCTASGGAQTITPPTSTSVVQLGNVSVNSKGNLHLRAGIYEVNTLKMNGNSTLTIDSGPVIIKIKGDGDASPLDLAGNGVFNTSLNSSMLQFVYGGNGNVKITGNTDTAALLYAPNATTQLAGQGNFYGAMVTNKVGATGGFDILYDRALQRTIMTAGNPTMTSFSWRTF